MSFIIRDKSGNPVLHRGQKIIDSNSAEMQVRTISTRNKTFTICASSNRRDRMGDIVLQEPDAKGNRGLDWGNLLIFYIDSIKIPPFSCRKEP